MIFYRKESILVMANKPSKPIKLLKSLGPGLITGASDDDPSGIATYSQAGAKFGLMTLWTALITFPLMVIIQEMCARIALCTASGLMTNIKKHYPAAIVYFVILLTIPAIVLNIGSDIAGMSAASQLLIPQISVHGFAILFTIILTVAIIYFPYQSLSNILKYLCLSLFLYIIVPFLIKQNWFEVLKFTFIPHIRFDKEFLKILVAILGTTISPYLFFWQATMESEDIKHEPNAQGRSFKEMRYDIFAGMFTSNLVMYFIIFTTGSVLYANGIQQIDTVEQAAKALEPLAGKLSYLLFSIGIIGTGLLSIPVLAGTAGYILTAAFNLEGGLDKKIFQAKIFYFIIIISLIISLIINLYDISPIQTLIYTAVMYGLTAPILILIILFIANNKKLMKSEVNGLLSNALGGICFILMSAAALALIWLQIY